MGRSRIANQSHPQSWCEADVWKYRRNALKQFFSAKRVNRDDIDDLQQECLLIYYTRRARVLPGKEDAFLRGIASVVLRAHFRKYAQDQVSARAASSNLCVASSPSFRYGADDAPIEQKLGRVLEEYVASLPPGMKRVVDLRYWKGLTIAQCARTLCVSWTTVSQADKRALVLLRQRLATESILGG